MKESCIDCINSYLWDGDWCCVPNFKILIYGEQITQSDIERLEQVRKDCEDFEKEDRELMIEMKKYYKIK